MVEKLKEIIIYNYSMSVMEKISKLSKNCCDDALLKYICDNYDEIECELNGDEYEESKKHDYNFCVACNKEVLLDSQKSILVCTKCGLCEYTPLAKLLARQARPGTTQDGSGNKAENYSSILATNQHQLRQKMYQ